MSIRIRINNIDKVESFMIQLPKRLDKELSKSNLDFMNKVLETARFYAPVDTGGLKEDIMLEPVKQGMNIKKWSIISGAPYSLFQEEGFTPHEFFLPNDSAKLQGGKSYYASKWTPFMKPAVDHNINLLTQSLQKGVSKATK